MRAQVYAERTSDGKVRLVSGKVRVILTERQARKLAAQLVCESDRSASAIARGVGTVSGALAALDDALCGGNGHD